MLLGIRHASTEHKINSIKYKCIPSTNNQAWIDFWNSRISIIFSSEIAYAFPTDKLLGKSVLSNERKNFFLHQYQKFMLLLDDSVK